VPASRKEVKVEPSFEAELDDAAINTVSDDELVFQYPVPGTPFGPDLNARACPEIVPPSRSGIGPSRAIAPLKGPMSMEMDEVDRIRMFDLIEIPITLEAPAALDD